MSQECAFVIPKMPLKMFQCKPKLVLLFQAFQVSLYVEKKLNWSVSATNKIHWDFIDFLHT